MPRELVSINQAAKALGMALSTLQHHIKRGNTTLIDGKIDLEVTRVQLAKYIDPAQSARRRGGRPRNDELMTADRVDAAMEGHKADASSDSAYWTAKTRREIAAALREELELQRLAGELVRAADVRKAAFERARILRDSLMGVPDRLAPELVGLPLDGIHARLSVEMRRVLHEVEAAWAPTT